MRIYVRCHEGGPFVSKGQVVELCFSSRLASFASVGESGEVGLPEGFSFDDLLEVRNPNARSSTAGGGSKEEVYFFQKYNAFEDEAVLGKPERESEEDALQKNSIRCYGADEFSLPEGTQVSLLFSDKRTLHRKVDSFGCIALPVDFPVSSLKGVRQVNGNLKYTFEAVDINKKKITNELLPVRKANVPKSVIGSVAFCDMADSRFFVDKTLLISDLLSGEGKKKSKYKESVADVEKIDKEQVTVITRPRRTGKTLNMKMIEAFFSERINGRLTKPIFDKLLIAKTDFYKNEERVFRPVMFVTFKGVHGETFEMGFIQVLKEIVALYRKHVIQDPNCGIYNKYKAPIDCILNALYGPPDKRMSSDRKSDAVILADSLTILSNYLHEKHGKKVVVLIDEYDTPLLRALRSPEKGHWVRMSMFMHEMFHSLLKDNNSLYKAVVTGILRVSKEGIFSGLNNVVQFSLLDDTYASYFGFTEKELEKLLARIGISSSMKYLECRYRGYQVAGHTLFNPWSILGALSGLNDQWVESASNTLIEEALCNCGPAVRKEMGTLLRGDKLSLTRSNRIIEGMIHGDMNSFIRPEDGCVDQKMKTVLFSFLFHCGYLTGERNKTEDKVWIPNLELLGFYMDSNVIDSFELTEEARKDINHYFQGKLGFMSKSSGKNVFNRPKQARATLHSPYISEIVKYFWPEDSNETVLPVVLSGAAGIGKTALSERYALDTESRYKRVIILKDFHRGATDRSRECREVLDYFSQNESIDEDLGLEAATVREQENILLEDSNDRAPRLLLDELSRLDSWLVVLHNISPSQQISPSQEKEERVIKEGKAKSHLGTEAFIEELIRISLQSESQSRHVLITSRSVGSLFWFNSNSVRLPFPSRKQAIEFFAKRLNMSPLLIGSQEIEDCLSRLAYYANYLTSRMEYFCFSIQRSMGVSGFVDARSIKEFLDHRETRSIEHVYNLHKQPDIYYGLINITHMGGVDSYDATFTERAGLVYKLFQGSEKMIEMCFSYLNERRARIMSREFAVVYGEMKKAINGSSDGKEENISKQDIFRRFINYLLDYLDQKFKKELGEVSKNSEIELNNEGIRKKLMVLSLFDSKGLPGFFLEKSLGSVELGTINREVIVSLRSLGFVFGHFSDAGLGEMALDVEVWKEIRKITLSSDEGNVIFQYAVREARIMLEKLVDTPSQLFQFVRPSLKEGVDPAEFSEIVRHYVLFLRALDEEFSCTNYSAFVLRFQVAYFLYLQDDFKDALKLLAVQQVKEAEKVFGLPRDYPLIIFRDLLKGRIHEQMGHYTKAIKFYKLVRDQNEKRHGLSVCARRFLLNILIRLDRRSEADRCYWRVKEDSRGMQGILSAQTHLAFGFYWSHRGEYKRSEEEYKKVKDGIGLLSSGKYDFYLACAEECLGRLFQARGKYEESKALLESAQSTYQKQSLPHNRLMISCRLSLAKLKYAIANANANAAADSGGLSITDLFKEFEDIIALLHKKGFTDSLLLVDAYLYALKAVARVPSREAKEKSLSFFEGAMRVISRLTSHSPSGSALICLGDSKGDFFREIGLYTDFSYVRIAHHLLASLLYYLAYSFVRDGDLLCANRLFEESLSISVGKYNVYLEGLSPTAKGKALQQLPDSKSLFSGGKRKSSVSTLLSSELFSNQKQTQLILSLYEVARYCFRVGRYTDSLKLLKSILDAQYDLYDGQRGFVPDREKVLRLLFHVTFLLGIYEISEEILDFLTEQASDSKKARHYDYLKIRLSFNKDYSDQKVLEMSKRMLSLAKHGRANCNDYLRAILFSLCIPMGKGNFKETIKQLEESIPESIYEKRPFAKAYYYLGSAVVYFYGRLFHKSQKMLSEGLRILDHHGIRGDDGVLSSQFPARNIEPSITRIRFEIFQAWLIFEEKEEKRLENRAKGHSLSGDSARDMLQSYLYSHKLCCEIRDKITAIEKNPELQAILKEGFNINSNKQKRDQCKPKLPEKVMVNFLLLKIEAAIKEIDQKIIDSSSCDTSVFKVANAFCFIDPVWRYMLLNQRPFWYSIASYDLKEKIINILLELKIKLAGREKTPCYLYLMFELIFLFRSQKRHEDAIYYFDELTNNTEGVVFPDQHFPWCVNVLGVILEADKVTHSSGAGSSQYESLPKEIRKKPNVETIIKELEAIAEEKVSHNVCSRVFFLEAKEVWSKFRGTPVQRVEPASMRDFLDRYFRCVVPSSKISYESLPRNFSQVVKSLLKSVSAEAYNKLNHYYCCAIASPVGSGRSVVIQDIVEKYKKNRVRLSGEIKTLWFSTSCGLSFETMLTHWMMVESQGDIASMGSFSEFIRRTLGKHDGRQYIIVLDSFDSLASFYKFLTEYIGPVLSKRCRLIVSVKSVLKESASVVSNKIPYYSQPEIGSFSVNLNQVVFSGLGSIDLWNDLLREIGLWVSKDPRALLSEESEGSKISVLRRSEIAWRHSLPSLVKQPPSPVNNSVVNQQEQKIAHFVRLMNLENQGDFKNYLFLTNFLLSSAECIYDNSDRSRMSILMEMLDYFSENLKMDNSRDVKLKVAFHCVFRGPTFLAGRYDTNFVAELMKALSFFEIEYLSLELISDLIKMLKENQEPPEEEVLSIIDSLCRSSLLILNTRVKSKAYYRIHLIARDMLHLVLEENSPLFRTLLQFVLEEFNYKRHDPLTTKQSSEKACYAVQFLHFSLGNKKCESLQSEPGYLELQYRIASYYLFHLRLPLSTLQLLDICKPQSKDGILMADFKALMAYANLLLHRFELAIAQAFEVKSIYEKHIASYPDKETEQCWAIRVKRGFVMFTLVMIYSSLGQISLASTSLAELEKESKLLPNPEEFASDKMVLQIEKLALSIKQSAENQFKDKSKENYLKQLDPMIDNLEVVYCGNKHQRIVIALLLKAELLSDPSSRLKILDRIDHYQHEFSPLDNSNMQVIKSFMMRARLYYEHPEVLKDSKSDAYRNTMRYIDEAISLYDKLFPKNSVTIDIVKCHLTKGRMLLLSGEYKRASESFEKARDLNAMVRPFSQAFELKIQVKYLTALFFSGEHKLLLEELATNPPAPGVATLFRLQVDLCKCITEKTIDKEAVHKIHEQLKVEAERFVVDKEPSNEEILFLEFLPQYILGWSAFMLGYYEESIQYAEVAKKLLKKNSEPVKNYQWFIDTLAAYSAFKSGDLYRAITFCSDALISYRDRYVQYGICYHPKVSEVLLVFIRAVNDLYPKGLPTNASGNEKSVFRLMTNVDLYFRRVVDKYNLSGNSFYIFLERQCDLVNHHQFTEYRPHNVGNSGEIGNMERKDNLVSKLIKEIKDFRDRLDAPFKGQKQLATNNGELPMKLTKEKLKNHATGSSEAKKAMSLFTYLSEQGWTWSSILREHLYDRKNKNRGSEKVVQCLIEHRAFVDYVMYRRAVESLFGDFGKPEKSFQYVSRKSYEQASIAEAGNDFRYFDFYVFHVKKITSTGEGSTLITVKIKAPGSRDLTSDVDTTVEVSIPEDSPLKYKDDQFVDCIKTASNEPDDVIRSMDKAIALQAAIVHHFNKLNVEQFGMTSAMSRDSNVYSGDLSGDVKFWKYFPSSDDFLLEEDRSVFSEVKEKKSHIGLASSLLSMREYFELRGESWSDFCSSFQEDLPTNVRPADFMSWIGQVGDLVEEWHSEKLEDAKRFRAKMELNPEIADLQKLTKDDIPLYIDSCLYVEKLFEVALIKGKINRHLDGLTFKATGLMELKKGKDATLRRFNTARRRYEEEQDPAQKEDDRVDMERRHRDLKDAEDGFSKERRNYRVLMTELASLKNELLTAQVKASFRALDAYPSPAAIYHTVHWAQKGSTDLNINRRQIVMGSICQQIGFYLLHAEEYRMRAVSEGEILYRTAKYGQRVADMLHGEEDSWFNNRITLWRSPQAAGSQAPSLAPLLRRLKGTVRDISLRKGVDFMLKRDVALVVKVKKDATVATEKKASEAYQLSLEAYANYMYGSERVLQNQRLSGVFKLIGGVKRELTRAELVKEEFEEFRLKTEPKILQRLVKEVIVRTLEVKVAARRRSDLESDSESSIIGNGGGGASGGGSKDVDSVVAWGSTFHL